MLKSTWTGTISFGLVSIPVKLFGATQEHGVTLHRTHETCVLGDLSDAGHRLSQRMICKDCGESVAYADQGSVFEDVDHSTVVLSTSELASLPGAKSRSIDLVEFVDPSEIEPLRFGKSYYVRPDHGNRKKPVANPQYALIVAALEKSGKAAIGTIVMRSRESLVAILPHDGGLVARTILWADELRAPQFDEPSVPNDELQTAHVKAALELVDAMSSSFDISRYVDKRETALVELIDSKRAAVKVAPSNVVPIRPNMDSLLAELNTAVAR